MKLFLDVKGTSPGLCIVSCDIFHSFDLNVQVSIFFLGASVRHWGDRKFADEESMMLEVV